MIGVQLAGGNCTGWVEERRELYTPNTFFYAHGRFSAAQSPSGVLHISVQALSLMRFVRVAG